MRLARLVVAGGAALALLLMLWAESARAADIPAALQQVKRWRLSFDYEETGRVTASDNEWELGIRASGTAVLERTDDPFGEWIGTPDVSVTYSYVGWRGDALCRTDERVAGSGAPEDIELSASLRFFSDGYQIEPSSHYVAVDRHYTLACPETHEGDESGRRYYYQHGIISDSIPYPTGNSLELRGTLHAEQKPNSEQTIGDINSNSQATLNYTLTPEVDALVLEIDDSGAYQDWRPSVADRQGAPGEPLTLHAELRRKSGAAPELKVRQFIWELVGTSHEPGFSMNFPVGSRDASPDLRLEAEGAKAMDEGQRIEHLLPTPGLADEVQVVPYDWGGWSSLKVTAVLEDGNRIEGVVKSSQEPELRLPKRAPDSSIADAWKRDAAASGADADDDDEQPVGDGQNGDGLTLYEEYRGFYVDGEPTFGNPAKKDLFVCAARPARAGVAVFKELSGLEVHLELGQSELGKDRVINANHGEGPHVTDQHALRVVVTGKLPAGTEHADLLGKAVGGPGNPKQILEVRLTKNWSQLPLMTRDVVVAHELFHAVNVYHHGEIDDTRVAWGFDEDGKLVEKSAATGRVQPIHVAREGEGDITNEVVEKLSEPGAKPLLGWVGKAGGQHSGSESCVMRYFAANAYIGESDEELRYVFPPPPEQPGFALCADPSGTGVNDPSRDPQSRYGAASESDRGDCEHQILVNDGVDPPAR